VTRIRFEWDESKNLANQRKHGISFDQASRVFDDPLYVSTLERIEEGEERWQTFGRIKGVLLLIVAHTVQEVDTNEETVRIITARRAEPHERRRYEAENG
jgi:uncharacterized DUF497 family protein